MVRAGLTGGVVGARFVRGVGALGLAAVVAAVSLVSSIRLVMGGWSGTCEGEDGGDCEKGCDSCHVVDLPIGVVCRCRV